MLPKRTSPTQDLQQTRTVSYSCMPNMNIILSRDKALISDYNQSQTQTSDKECNCRKKDQCPLDGKCLTQNVVYKPQSQDKHHQTHTWALPQILKSITKIIQHPFYTKARERKLNCLNTFGHSKTTTNLLPPSG